MRIGILTYFWALNPGTLLQAYSTYNTVKNSFPTDEVELIDVKFRKVHFKIAKSYLFSPEIIFRAYSRYILYQEAYKDVKFSVGQYTGKDAKKALDFIKKQEYDAIIVGSDTIFQLYDWNLDKEMLPFYYLEGVDTKKIMLAASCGSTSINDFSDNMKKVAYKSLNDFYKLGVRDKNTFDLFAELKGNNDNLTILPDPTFTYEIDQERTRKTLEKYNFNFKIPSVILSLPDKFKLLSDTIRYFKSIGWNIITFDYKKYADYCFFVEPAVWAGIPKFVDMVITDRFHGSVFSIRNNTPVIAVDCDTRRISIANSSKNKCLLEEYGLLNNYINYNMNPSLESYFNIINKVRNSRVNFDNMNYTKKSIYLNYVKNIFK
jgi:hypothetical protein